MANNIDTNPKTSVKGKVKAKMLQLGGDTLGAVGGEASPQLFT